MFNYLTIAYGLFLWYFVFTKGFFFFTFINDQFNTDTLSILTLSTVPSVSVLTGFDCNEDYSPPQSMLGMLWRL